MYLLIYFDTYSILIDNLSMSFGTTCNIFSFGVLLIVGKVALLFYSKKYNHIYLTYLKYLLMIITFIWFSGSTFFGFKFLYLEYFPNLMGNTTSFIMGHKIEISRCFTSSEKIDYLSNYWLSLSKNHNSLYSDEALHLSELEKNKCLSLNNLFEIKNYLDSLFLSKKDLYESYLLEQEQLKALDASRDNLIYSYLIDPKTYIFIGCVIGGIVVVDYYYNWSLYKYLTSLVFTQKLNTEGKIVELEKTCLSLKKVSKTNASNITITDKNLRNNVVDIKENTKNISKHEKNISDIKFDTYRKYALMKRENEQNSHTESIVEKISNNVSVVNKSTQKNEVIIKKVCVIAEKNSEEIKKIAKATSSVLGDNDFLTELQGIKELKEKMGLGKDISVIKFLFNLFKSLTNKDINNNQTKERFPGEGNVLNDKSNDDSI